MTAQPITWQLRSITNLEFALMQLQAIDTHLAFVLAGYDCRYDLLFHIAEAENWLAEYEWSLHMGKKELI